MLRVEVPLRICPLGAHIDHQRGIVTGMAIDRGVVLVATPSAGSTIEIESLDFGGVTTADIRVPAPSSTGGWGDYVRAAVAALGERFELRHGFKAVISGPLAGAGLSSSAAVILAYIIAAARINGVDLSPADLPAMVQRAENRYVGVRCGLLDPAVIVHSRAGSLTVIDCLDGSADHAEPPTDAPAPAILVAFSGLRRELAGSGFNTRVEECERAASMLLEYAGGDPVAEPTLRSVDAEVFDAYGHRLPERLRRRARHFFSEMDRVSAGVTAWRRGDLVSFGELVSASGESSICNYECGIPATVSLVRSMAACDGVYGARFAGAGFGGSCVALVVAEHADEVAAEIGRRFAMEHSELADRAAVHVCRSAGTFRVIEEVS